MNGWDATSRGNSKNCTRMTAVFAVRAVSAAADVLRSKIPPIVPVLWEARIKKRPGKKKAG